jgi:hypothetical protein
MFAAALILVLAIRWRNYQWDFGMFRWSAADYLAGRDPYKGTGLLLLPSPAFSAALQRADPHPIRRRIRAVVCGEGCGARDPAGGLESAVRTASG